MRIQSFLAAVAALGLGVASVAADSDAEATSGEFGPAVGSTPSALSLADETGALRTLSDLSGEKGVVVFFVRAADWCPVCQAQLLDLNGRLAEFEDRGYAVAAVTTDEVAELAEFDAKRSISYTLLADTDSALTRAWGLVDPANPGPRSYGFIAHNGLPYPTTLVLSPEGVVEAKLLVADELGDKGGYKQRITVDDALAAIAGLSAE